MELNMEEISDKVSPLELNDNNNIKYRVFECELCKSKKHSITKCSKYKELKKELNKNNYILLNSDKMYNNEENGFCASGIIPYVIIKNKVFLLVLIETRYKKTGLNFIGGKRECIKLNNIIRPETSYETAITELEEELGEIMTNESTDMIVKEIKKYNTPNFVFWSGESKMSLYGIKLPSYFISKLKLNNMDKTNTEAEGFKWIGYNGIGYMENKNNLLTNSYKLHSYSKNILNNMRKLCLNKDLNNLFM